MSILRGNVRRQIEFGDHDDCCLEVSLRYEARKVANGEMSESLNIICGENLDETHSCFRSLTVTTQATSVVVSWQYERPKASVDEEFVFKLLKLETRDEWKAIAWTRKMTCTVVNLEQNVCYSLQLLALVERDDEFEVIDKSEVFKVRALGSLQLSTHFDYCFSAQFKLCRRIKLSFERCKSRSSTSSKLNLSSCRISFD